MTTSPPPKLTIAARTASPMSAPSAPLTRDWSGIIAPMSAASSAASQAGRGDRRRGGVVMSFLGGGQERATAPHPEWGAAPSIREGRVSEAGDLLGQLGLALRGLVGVDDALAHGLVELAAGGLERGRRGLLVAGGDGLTHAAHVGLELGLHGLVAKARLLVGEDALLLGLDVRHWWYFSYVSPRTDGSVRAVRVAGTGARGYPWSAARRPPHDLAEAQRGTLPGLGAAGQTGGVAPVIPHARTAAARRTGRRRPRGPGRPGAAPGRARARARR